MGTPPLQQISPRDKGVHYKLGKLQKENSLDAVTVSIVYMTKFLRRAK
jgi:hypothetical protein